MRRSLLGAPFREHIVRHARVQRRLSAGLQHAGLRHAQYAQNPRVAAATRCPRPVMKPCDSCSRASGRVYSAEADGGALEPGMFMPIDVGSDVGIGGTSDEQRFGPDALLLCGFFSAELSAVRELLSDLGADFVRVIMLEPGMEQLTLGQALQSGGQEQPGAGTAARLPALGVPRILFLSGMSSQEVSMFIDAFLELELPQTIFAAAVPKSVDKPLAQLFDEITGDHERLMQQKRAAA